MIKRDITVSAETVRDNMIAWLQAIREIPPNIKVTKFTFNPEALNNQTIIPIHWEGQEEKEAIITRHHA